MPDLLTWLLWFLVRREGGLMFIFGVVVGLMLLTVAVAYLLNAGDDL